MTSREMANEQFAILLIEDNPADSDLVSEMLEASGRSAHVLSLATRMSEAEQRLRNQDFDLVLLDLRLPDASGLDAVRIVREIARDVPLIVLTGIEDEYLALSCINDGAQDYLCKGEIQPLTLRRSIDHAITRAREAQLRAKLSAQLQQAQKMEALGTLAGGIAHDFNNSLAVILGNSDICLEDLPQESPVREYVEEIRKAAELAKDLVGRILAFSRPHQPRKSPVSLEQAAEETIKLIASTIPKSIQIRAEFPDDLPEIAADPPQIHQILVNLCTNASHAIGNRTGEIKLSGEVVTFGLGSGIPGSEVHSGKFVCLNVQDDGSGFDDAIASRVFEPFFTTKPPGKGSGLGLSIVHSIVKSHHGAVTVMSEPDRGTTFKLYFPPFTEARQELVNPVQRSVDGTGKHILFVDDDEALLYLIPRRLRRLGFEVTAHLDAREAIADFRSRPTDFDAVVSDFNMPSMTGSDLVKELHAIRPGIPTIVTSGFIRDEDALVSRQAGAHALIPKPSSIEEMANLIQSVLERAEQ